MAIFALGPLASSVLGRVAIEKTATAVPRVLQAWGVGSKAVQMTPHRPEMHSINAASFSPALTTPTAPPKTGKIFFQQAGAELSTLSSDHIHFMKPSHGAQKKLLTLQKGEKFPSSPPPSKHRNGYQMLGFGLGATYGGVDYFLETSTHQRNLGDWLGKTLGYGIGGAVAGSSHLLSFLGLSALAGEPSL